MAKSTSDPTKSPTGPGKPADETTSTDATPDGGPTPVCEVPRDVTKPLPDMLALVRGILVSQLPGIPVELQPTPEVIKALQDDLGIYFLKPGYGYIGPTLFKRIGTLMLAKAAMDLELTQEARPPSANMLPAAATSVINTIKTVPEASAMDIKADDLSQQKDVLDYRREWLDAVTWLLPVVKANLASTEQQVAKTIDGGLKAVKGLLPKYYMLRDGLKDALAWSNWSPNQAQATNKDHKKLIEKMSGPGHEGGGTPVTGEGNPPTGTPSGTGTPPTGHTATPAPATGNPPASPPANLPRPTHRRKPPGT